jgi:hypothetical protein
MSKWSIASFAMFNCSLALLNRLFLHVFNRVAVVLNRLCNLIVRLFPWTGCAQASATISLNSGILVQNCSNLKCDILGCCLVYFPKIL